MPESPEAARQALQDRLAAIAHGLRGVDNVGLSRDARDLYSWLSEATEAVDRAVPELPCKAGCSSCCEGPLFRVTEAEYRAFVSRTPEPVLARLRERAAEVYGPHRAAMERLAARWAGDGGPLPGELPGRCPALDDAGMCEAYAGRPAVCRLYGYGAAQLDTGAAVLVCSKHAARWQAAAEATGITHLPLPTWGVFERLLGAFPGGRSPKPLPLWLLEEGATPS